jgi:S-DNA-T family DNA segregation ATPase FtsK/SpoIIIE
MAARKRSRKPVRKPARKRRRGSVLDRGLPQLDQHQLDLIGLGLVALSAFFACVFYLGWAGGQVGEAMADGFVYLFGAVGYLAPVVLLGAGAVLVLRPMLPSVKAFRAGAVCLIAGLSLGLAAGSFGLGPSDGAHGFRDPSQFRHHGGAAGEALFWAARTLFQDIGAHILFVFLLLTGVLLLTGASVAGVIQATRRTASTATQRMRRTSGGLAAATQRLDPTAGGAAAAVTRQDGGDPPEVEPVVRATHVEAPALDGSDRYPDLYGAPDEPPEADDWRQDEPEPAGDPAGATDADLDLAVEPAAAQPLAAQDAPAPAQESSAGEDRQMTPQGNRRSAVTEADDYEYSLPRAGFLKQSKGQPKTSTKDRDRVGTQLVEALGHFGVESKVVGAVTGPHVTRYEIRLKPGIKMSKVASLRDDLAYALAAEDVRILAPIPGRQAVGVEVPNSVRRMVHLGDVLQKSPEGYSPLTVWLGKDIAGRAIGADLAKQPHILVAGTTGSGKSGCVNAMLSSILLRATPNEVRMVLVDPKQVELNLYEGIPHLLTPVVTSPRLAANVLQNLIREMEERYSIMSRARARSVIELNKKREQAGERPLPYILCVIDELADLMMIAPSEVEDAIIRLAQKSRAVGIHLLLATQRPSADIITGMIKANVPARIAFAVSSQTDSRVILDQNGAESLLGKGDMLFRPAGESKTARIQGAFTDEDEIEKLTEHWRRQGEPELKEELLEAPEVEEEPEAHGGDFDPDDDDLLGDAIATVVQMGTASTSMLQRRLRVGYTRAGRLIDMMERRGVISGYEGSKARQVLVTEADLPRVLSSLADPPAQTVVAGSADEPA